MACVQTDSRTLSLPRFANAVTVVASPGGDQLGGGDESLNAVVRERVVEVEGRALAPERAARRGVEQGFVLVARPDPFAGAVRVTGPGDAGGRTLVAEEELGLLRRRQEQLRMAGQRGMERGRARLGRADHEEVGQCHRASQVPIS